MLALSLSKRESSAIDGDTVAGWLVSLAAFDWLQVVLFTMMGTGRPEVLGLGVPTLMTQGLLVFGMALGSNVARVSYLGWTLFAVLLEVTGGGVYASTAPYAEQWTQLGDVLTAVLVLGLFWPSVHRAFVAIARTRQEATAAVQKRRYLRNIKVGLAWVAVSPISLAAGYYLTTPTLAVVLSAAPSMLVAAVILGRNGWKLWRLSRSVSV
jgi:hypothetical protein